MKVRLDAEEIIKIAVSMELNGEEGYREAAEKSSDIKIAHIFNELADMEKDHAKYFSSMFQGGALNNEGIVEVEESESSLKIANMISHGVFSSYHGKGKSVLEILDNSLDVEKRSIEFYTSLKDVFPRLMEDTDLELIIQEERNHIEAVNKAIVELKELR